MKILFVCLGNICRSPLAEYITREKLNTAGFQGQVQVASAGFEPFHQDDPADHRAVLVASKHGIDMRAHRARLFKRSDFDTYDRIFVMDQHNFMDVMQVARNEADKSKVDFLMNVLKPDSNAIVPDPWYGGLQGFEETYTSLAKAADQLIIDIQRLMKSE